METLIFVHGGDVDDKTFDMSATRSKPIALSAMDATSMLVGLGGAPFLALSSGFSLIAYQNLQEEKTLINSANYDSDMADRGAVVSIVAVVIAVLAMVLAMAAIASRRDAKAASGMNVTAAVLMLVSVAFAIAGMYNVYRSTMVENVHTCSKETLDVEYAGWSLIAVASMIAAAYSYAAIASAMSRAR